MGTFTILHHQSDAEAARVLRMHLALMRRHLGWREVGLDEQPMMVLAIMSAALVAEHEAEMEAALRMQADGVRVIPIRYRPFDGHAKMTLQAVPREPVIEYACQDTAWTTVAEAVRDAAKKILVVRQGDAQGAAPQQAFADASTRALPPRSGRG